MTKPFSITRWGGVGIALLMLTLGASDTVAASPKRVLILSSFGRDVAPFSAAISVLRTTLPRELGEPVEFHEVPLNLARFAEAEGEDPLVAFLEGRLKSQPVDLVVPVGAPGMQFATRHRDRLFPEAPVLVVGADPRFMQPGLPRTNDTFVTFRVSLTGMVEDILQMQPQTTNIAVVFGASALEQVWLDECRREFQTFSNRVRFTWLNELALEQVLERCATLPPRSFILFGLFLVDARGLPCEKNEALRRLRETANAPLFGYFASELGLGIIGGRLYEDFEVGAAGARTAARILRGESPGSIPPQVIEAGVPVYDWRELQRWGVSESRLPTGSRLQFRQPGLWEHYGWLILGIGFFCLLQAALIVGLLINRARRRQGEAEATLIAEVSSKFINLEPGEVDREITEALRRLGEFLGLEVVALWQWPNGAPASLTLTHLHQAGNGPALPGRMDASGQLPWFQEQLWVGRILSVSSPEDLPTEALRDRETWRRFGLKATLVLPLLAGGGPPLGALSFATMAAERDWPEALVNRLQVVAQLFANALARDRADQALRESELRLSLAAESAEAGLWVLDFGTHVFWATDKTRLIFGYSPDETITMACLEASVHPEDWPRIQEGIERSLHSRDSVSVEYRIRHRDGRQRWLASRGRPCFRSTGEPERLLGLSMDITERKQADEVMRDLSGRLIRAQEEDRARLARELHDDVTQRLARLAIDLGRVEQGLPGRSVSDTLSEVRQGLVSLSADVHDLSYRLHPALLEDLGLAEALKAECQRFTRQDSLPITLKLGELPAALPEETALCLFRITQEALRNVVRHAQARVAEVSLRPFEGGLQLAVRDDGIGFDPVLERDRPSLGLASMMERVHLLGGELDVESVPGHGTTLVAWVPLKGDPA